MDVEKQLLLHFTSLPVGLEILLSESFKSGLLANTNDRLELFSTSILRDSIPFDMEERFDQFSYMCFSKAAQWGGFPNQMQIDTLVMPTMRAHYAKHQHGVCLIFDREKLEATIKGRYPNARYGDIEISTMAWEEPVLRRNAQL